MSPLIKIIYFLVLIIVGLNLSANNMFVSLLHNYVFFKDAISARLIRIFGIIMMLSSILIILNYTTYCIYVNLIMILILTFFSIRGRNKALREKLSAREQLLKAYQDEIRLKRERLEKLKQGVTKAEQSEAKTVSDIKKQMWDDGKMTSKDLIDGFKKNN